MRNALGQVDAPTRREALVGFATLLLLMAGYTTLETARDALFLASIPATNLPWAYLGVAALAFLATNALDEIGRGRRRLTLVAWILASAGVTAAFYAFVRDGSAASLYGLYAWGGVLTTVVLTRFWSLLASRFTVVQAKSIYPFIGAGSVGGALLGTGLSGLLTTSVGVDGRTLLLVAAVLLVAAGVASLGLSPVDDEDEDAFSGGLTAAGRTRGVLLRDDAREPPPRADRNDLWEALRAPYPRRVFLIVTLSSVTLTVVDYVFKATVAAAVPPAELAGFFARVYFGLNLLSLVAQLLLVRGTVRALSVAGAIAVLPVLLMGGGVFFALSSGVTAALALKAADGALRHSLHRTAVELLYVPMARRARTAVKPFADVVGQRGGQALASLALLGAFALGADALTEDLAVLVLALAWVGLAYLLRTPYLDLFRETLRDEARRGRHGFPELDRGSLEAVIAALNSVNDREVLAALDSLEAEDKVRLVPALILYHPSEDIVTRALELLAAHRREDILPITDRLLEARVPVTPAVRAAALRARVTLGAEPGFLRSFLQDESVDVRATALVGLAAHFGGRLEEATDALEDLARRGRSDARLAIARAIAHRPAHGLEGIVLGLSRDEDVEVRSAALDAMRADPRAAYQPRLCELLQYRATRARAREALVAMGDEAFDVLSGALGDERRPTSERRHVPRTLMLFDPRRAAKVLLDRYPVEHDRIVQHKILRALSHIQRRDPAVRFERAALDRLLERALARALGFRDRRLILERGAEDQPELGTTFHELLTRLLRDLEDAKIDQVFAVLGLENPHEDVRAIQRGLASPRRAARAGAAELLEHLTRAGVREAFVALVNPDEGDPYRAVRLGAAIHRPMEADYRAVIEDLVGDRNEAVRSLAVYQAGVLGMHELLPEIRALEASQDGFLDQAVRRVEEQLAGLRPSILGAPQ